MSALGITMNGSLPPSSSTVFLSCRPGGAGHLPARLLAAGQRRARDARIVEDALDLVRVDQQRLERAVRKAGAPEDVLDQQRALRHVRRVLEQHDVAGHQRGRGEPEDLPERKVPRHHREDRTERLVADEALGRRALRTGSSASMRAACSA